MASTTEAKNNGWTISTKGESRVFFTSESCDSTFEEDSTESRLKENGMPTNLTAFFESTGTATLRFSNCKPWQYHSGVVSVYLDDKMIQTSRAFGRDTQVTFNFSSASTLTIATDSLSVLELQSFDVECGN